MTNSNTNREHRKAIRQKSNTADYQYTLMTLISDASTHVNVLVAQPAALVAMKLQSAMNREAAK